MDRSVVPSRVIGFGQFEARLDSSKLLRQGSEMVLQYQPFP